MLTTEAIASLATLVNVSFEARSGVEILTTGGASEARANAGWVLAIVRGVDEVVADGV
jgi:hypothetical protein